MAEAGSVPSSDHDLLIRIDTKLEGLTTDLKDFKNTSAQQITDIYRNKAAKTDLEALRQDHEPRIRFLEKYGWMAVGGLGLIQIVAYYWSRLGGH